VFSYRCNLIPENNSCNELLLYKHYVKDAVDTSFLGIITLGTVDGAFEDAEICRIFSRVIICFYEFTPCDTNSSKLLPICTEWCSELDRIIKTCGDLVNINFRNYYNCLNPDTYYPSPQVAISTTSCSKSLKSI